LLFNPNGVASGFQGLDSQLEESRSLRKREDREDGEDGEKERRVRKRRREREAGGAGMQKRGREREWQPC